MPMLMLFDMGNYSPMALRVEANNIIAFSSKCSAMIRLIKKHGIPRKNLIMMILSTSESVRL